jgi:hypothetical protein
MGTSVGWWLPSRAGTTPSTVHRAAWKSIIATIDSTSDVWTQRPSPVRWRSWRATRMPTAR